MRCRCAALGAAQMQRAGFKRDVGPLQAAEFRCSQPMPERNQDHGRVTLAPPIAPCGLDELADLALCQMLAWPKLAVRSPQWRDCPIFLSWRDQLERRFRHVISPSVRLHCRNT